MTDIGDTDFGVQIGLGFFGKVATAIFGLIGSIFVARIVGPAGYGIFYVSMSISQFIENPVTGWATACKKRMTESDFDTSEALGSVLLMMALIIAFGGPLSFFVLSISTENPIIPVAVPLIFIATSSYWALSTFLSGTKNFSLSIWSGTLNTLVQIIGRVILVVVGFDVWGMLGGTVVGPIIVLPILYRWIDVRPSLPSWDSIKSIAEYARWSIPSGFVSTALSRMDMVLLGWLVTASVAGKYQVGLQITMPAIFVSSVIGTGLMGRVSNLESRQQNWQDDLRNSLSYGSILSVPIFFGSIVIGEELAVTVFGRGYSGAGIFVIGLALYRLVKTQITPYRSVIRGLDRPDIVFNISLASFMLNIVSGVALWWFIGAAGIVIATALSSMITYLLTVHYIRRITNIDFVFTRPFIKQVISGAVMTIVIYMAKETYGIVGWIEVFGYVMLGGIIYGSLEVMFSSHLRSTAVGIWDDFKRSFQ